MEEHVTQTYHVGTHLDGLGHVGIGGRYYNGLHYADFYRPTGLTRLGIEAVRPWASRGVRVDVAQVVGVDMLAVTGTHLLENLRTDELAACGQAEFLFVCAPAKTRGSTASMVAPLAVV